MIPEARTLTEALNLIHEGITPIMCIKNDRRKTCKNSDQVIMFFRNRKKKYGW